MSALLNSLREKGSKEDCLAALERMIGERDRLRAALEAAPIVSKFSDAEAFIDAFGAWRDAWKLPALRPSLESADMQALTAAEGRLPRGWRDDS